MRDDGAGCALAQVRVRLSDRARWTHGAANARATIERGEVTPIDGPRARVALQVETPCEIDDDGRARVGALNRGSIGQELIKTGDAADDRGG